MISSRKMFYSLCQSASCSPTAKLLRRDRPCLRVHLHHIRPGSAAHCAGDHQYSRRRQLLFCIYPNASNRKRKGSLLKVPQAFRPHAQDRFRLFRSARHFTDQCSAGALSAVVFSFQFESQRLPAQPRAGGPLRRSRQDRLWLRRRERRIWVLHLSALLAVTSRRA